MTLSVAIAAGPQLCICASVLGGNRVGSKAGSRVMQQATTNIEETDTRFHERGAASSARPVEF